MRQIFLLFLVLFSLFSLIGCENEEKTQKNDIDMVEEPQEDSVVSDKDRIKENIESQQANERDEKNELTNVKAVQFLGIEPTTLYIPAIDVETEIVPVGILENGEMGVPEDDTKVGWFEPGYQPGLRGNAVIAGHVDNKRGPAVFFYLKDLKKGDKIHVSNDNGVTLTFIVQKTESYKTEEAPIQEIFGKFPRPRLNLITCTGRFDRKLGGHEERLVVYTELVH